VPRHRPQGARCRSDRARRGGVRADHRRARLLHHSASGAQTGRFGAPEPMITVGAAAAQFGGSLRACVVLFLAEGNRVRKRSAERGPGWSRRCPVVRSPREYMKGASGVDGRFEPNTRHHLRKRPPGVGNAAQGPFPSCQAMYQDVSPRSMRSSGYVHIADSVRTERAVRKTAPSAIGRLPAMAKTPIGK
jgi:hypothetical protein